MEVMKTEGLKRGLVWTKECAIRIKRTIQGGGLESVNGFFEALIKFIIREREEYKIGEGDDLISAFFSAFKKGLSSFFPALSEIKLENYSLNVSKSGSKKPFIKVWIKLSKGEKKWNHTTTGSHIVDVIIRALEEAFNKILSSM